MATKTTIVIGRPQEGEVETKAGSFAKKINDVTTAAATYTVSIAKKGSSIVAVIVYTES